MRSFFFMLIFGYNKQKPDTVISKLCAISHLVIVRKLWYNILKEGGETPKRKGDKTMKRTSKEFWKWYHEEKWNIPFREREAWEHKALMEWWNELEVGDHAHINHWSDVSPVTVIKRTAKTITVRYDKATLDPTWKPEFIVGGFSAHCTNNDEQRWIIEEDPNGRTETFRLRNVGWRNKSDEKLYPEWAKKYDYNF